MRRRAATRTLSVRTSLDRRMEPREPTTPHGMAASSKGYRRLGRPIVIVTAGILIALTWIGARGAIQSQQAASQARAEAVVVNEALAFEAQVRRQLLAIDQTLRILQMEWRRDPAHFDLKTWADQVVALTDVSLQIFLTDAQGTVRASSRDAIVGTDVSGRDYFRHEAGLPADDGKMFIGSLTRGLVTRQWQLNLVRRLDRPDGSFAGVISASYDPRWLGQFYDETDLGTRGVMAVVSLTDGSLRALVRPTVAEPPRSIAGSPMFAAMVANPNGAWIGPSAFDGIDRINVFRAVPNRDLAVVVGIDKAEAMRSSITWENSVVVFAGGVTAFVLLAAGLLLWEDWAARRREETLTRDRAVLAAAEARAQAKTAQLNATLTGMTDGIMMVDADLRLVEWNARFPEFTGVPPEILRVGMRLEDIWRAQAAAGEFGAVDVEAEVARRRASLDPESNTEIVQRLRPGGRRLELRRNPLPGGGFVTLYSDVTARRQTEERLQQAEKMAAIGRLTSGLAHDFNNLLASVIGNAEMLHGALSDQPAQARRASIILQAASRGEGLIRQLLAFSRNQTLAPTRLDLNRIVRGIDELLHSTVGKSIRIEMRLDEQLWPATADAVQIEHLLLNLVINARDAMPDGGLLMIATSNASLDPSIHSAVTFAGDYVRLSVTDTGTGIAADALDNVFEPFFTTKPPGKGAGLGLSQVYGVASQSGGGVNIESAPGKGTAVAVFFPRAAPETPIHQRKVEPSDAPAGPTNSGP
jgi:signal transduction histidine kinase